MPDPIRLITLVQFAELLEGAQLTRKIVEVHVHHTWRPRRQDFRGLATIEAMRRFHMETNGWADIAQHLTIDPEGGLWTGRNWNQRPASSSGANGSDAEGPFMFEMIGDFDAGHDPFDGPQKAAAVGVCARILRRFDLKTDAVRFHRQLGSPKTCPGTGIDYDQFKSDVGTALKGIPAKPRARDIRRPFSADRLTGFAVTRALDAAPDPDFAEVPEHASAAGEIERLSRAATGARQLQASRSRGTSPFARDGGCGNPEWNVLKPHAVNLSRGELSEGGEFCTRPDDLDGIIDAIRAYAAATPQPHVVLYAHGGLVGEKPALEYARTVLPWWKGHGVFPVFFIWESGLLEILRQFVVGPRDLADFTTDPAIEIAAKIPGTLAWNGMKESARRASNADAGNGFAGGALQFARLLGPLVAQNPAIKVHAVGHSAGAIFHAHLVPQLKALNVSVESMALLAPAARVDLFEEKLLPLVGNGVTRLAFFTMEDDAERQDDCFKVYRKSLLYLVSRSFESVLRRPIVGLEAFIKKDADLKSLFGLDGSAARAELQLSRAPGHDPNPLTAALRHGDFDNDPKTMSSVLRRVLQVGDETGLGEDDFPFSLTPRSLDEIAPPAPLSAPVPSPAAPAVVVQPAAGSRPRALCVGINTYPTRPLSGCVQDARTWGALLDSLGYAVTYLLDGEATRESMVRAFTDLVASAGAGAPAVLQYSGHGTQLPDDNGDESDGFDEAFVPVDYHLGRFLLDDDVAGILSRLPADGAITLFMDCCHSGTNSRFAPLLRARAEADERVRFLPAGPELVEAHREFRRSARAYAAAPGTAEQSLRGVVHFAACQDSEFAWESGGQGDFTGVASRLLKEAVTRADTNEAFIAAVQRGVAAKGRQHPMMMRLAAGLSGRPLLGRR